MNIISENLRTSDSVPKHLSNHVLANCNTIRLAHMFARRPATSVFQKVQRVYN